MEVIRAGEEEGQFVFTVTDGGYAKRTAVDEYRARAAAASASRPCRSWRTGVRWSERSS